MSEGEQKTAAPKEHPAMGQIVGNLKEYPFLLITVAGLLILSGILIFDIEKLKEFKWLIYAVVLAPLAIQFLIEFRKMAPGPARPDAPSAASAYPPPPPSSALPPNRKAWISVGIGMLLFGVVAATPETELYDQDFALGFLVAALVAAGFAFVGMSDVKHQRAGGKGTAITGIVLSIVLVLAGIGWMMEAHTPAPAPAVDAAASVPPLPGAAAMPPLAALPPMAPASPASPARGMLPLEGLYQLLAHQVNGIPQAAGGALAIARQPSGQYQWHAQLIVQDVGGAQTLVYNGQILNRGGKWFIRIVGSSDPGWEDLGEMPMELVSDGRNAAFRYVYDGDLVQSAWARSP
jgi:FtsH-binding integral membrane protein